MLMSLKFSVESTNATRSNSVNFVLIDVTIYREYWAICPKFKNTCSMFYTTSTLILILNGV
jgi:hypothetical protein